MNNSIVIFALFVIITGYPSDFSETVEECIKKEELGNETLKIYQYLQHPMVPSDDDEYNKFFGCYWKSLGLLDKFGNVDTEKVDKYFEDWRGNKIPTKSRADAISKCKHFHGGSCGQRAVKIYNCINLHFSELGLLSA
ncbi:hypothetical protein PPYR_01579 [Photinus pyralis]|uniref:Uncharacterized protein n=1 Tax=Photinus pyralis TaxID=7054 RepID=A0A1Y1LIF6_PHOPY|nr:uncharacterized protein LOC116159721 [Photinus pyralis]KAB0804609.1 hypothetical protein PPYR_01579 [Photinus pyralis]